MKETKEEIEKKDTKGSLTQGQKEFKSPVDKFKAMDPQKASAVSEAIKRIKSEYGQGAIMFLGENRVENIGTISTGSILLDNALGIKGVPRGRITEIYGYEGSGKTTLALHVIANAQKNGGICAFIDAEHALDMNYAQTIGIKVSDLILAQPNSGEEALSIAETLIRSGGIDLIVIDSVAALVPRSEIEGTMEDVSMGTQARLMSKALRKITPTLSKTNTALIFINQIRLKIGIMFGAPETTSGGTALRFYSSLRLEIKKKTLIKKADVILGQETEVKVAKNKFAPPFKKIEFELIYGAGINNTGEIIDLCVEKNILTKSGTWFSYGERKLGQGKDFVQKVLQEDVDLFEELKKKAME